MTFNELTRFSKNFSSPHTQVRWGGGGGDTSSTTTSGIADEFSPDLKALLEQAQGTYAAGDLGQVAGTSDIQGTVFGAAPSRINAGLGSIAGGQDVAYDASVGQGLFGTGSTQALKDAAIRDARTAFAPVADAEAAAGLVGGSRQQLAAGEREAQMAGVLSSIDYQAEQERRVNALSGGGALISGGQAEAAINQGNLGGLAQIGGMQRDVQQEVLDANALALERYTNVFGSVTGGQTQSATEETGGGK
jgi:hypothetical protein